MEEKNDMLVQEDRDPMTGEPIRIYSRVKDLTILRLVRKMMVTYSDGRYFSNTKNGVF